MLMIRPRAGDFLYEEDEIQIMLRNIGRAKKMGVKGVVFGLLRPDGRIDLANTARLIEAARPMEVTFHRAFDVCRDPYQGLDDLMELEVDHLLTSGQAPNAEAGIPLIRDLVSRAEGQITIMAGAGVRALNVAQIVAETGVTACHTSASRNIDSKMTFRHPVVHMGLPQIDDYSRNITDPIMVRQVMREMIAGHQSY
jgi:copper homeostasis protein